MTYFLLFKIRDFKYCHVIRVYTFMLLLTAGTRGSNFGTDTDFSATITYLRFGVLFTAYVFSLCVLGVIRGIMWPFKQFWKESK